MRAHDPAKQTLTIREMRTMDMKSRSKLAQSDRQSSLRRRREQTVKALCYYRHVIMVGRAVLAFRQSTVGLS